MKFELSLQFSVLTSAYKLILVIPLAPFSGSGVLAS